MTVTVASPKPARPHLFPFRALEQLLHTDDSRELARRFNVSRRTILRWRTRGLTDNQADRLACHLGLVPEIVPGWDWETLTAVTEDDVA